MILYLQVEKPDAHIQQIKRKLGNASDSANLLPRRSNTDIHGIVKTFQHVRNGCNDMISFVVCMKRLYMLALRFMLCHFEDRGSWL